MKFYVYHLIDPRNSEVFYVGKGTGKRLFQHEAEVRKGKVGNYDKYRRIKEIIDNGQSVVAKRVKEFVTEQDAYEYERIEVSRIGLENLTNMIEGGVLSADVIAKRRLKEKERQLKSLQENRKLIELLAERAAPYMLGLVEMFLPGDIKVGKECFDGIRDLIAASGIPMGRHLLTHRSLCSALRLPTDTEITIAYVH